MKAVSLSSLFPIDLTSLVFWNATSPDSQFRLYFNTELDRGLRANRVKVARGSLPTFAFSQDPDGTWRLHHAPLDHLQDEKKLEAYLDEISSVLSAQQGVVENVSLLSKAFKKAELGTSEFAFYSNICSNLLHSNGVKNFEIRDFRELRNGKLSRSEKETLFDLIVLQAPEHTPSKFLKGGKLLQEGAGASFTQACRDSDTLVLSGSEGKQVHFDRDQFASKHWKAHGNLEMLLLPASGLESSHVPWYATLAQVDPGLLGSEIISPMSCHDIARTSYAMCSPRRLYPSGYSIVDYPAVDLVALLDAVLGGGADHEALDLWRWLADNYPHSSEKLAKNQGTEVGRLLLKVRRSLLDSLPEEPDCLDLPVAHGGPSSIILWSVIAEQCRQWCNARSPRTVHPIQHSWLKDQVAHSGDISVGDVLRRIGMSQDSARDWLIANGAQKLPEAIEIELKQWDEVPITGAVSLSNQAQKDISRYCKYLEALAYEYLRCAAFVIATVLKADLLRASLLHPMMDINPSVAEIIQRRPVKWLEQKIAIF